MWERGRVEVGSSLGGREEAEEDEGEAEDALTWSLLVDEGAPRPALVLVLVLVLVLAVLEADREAYKGRLGAVVVGAFLRGTGANRKAADH